MGVKGTGEDSGVDPGTEVSTRILTLPNLITGVRISFIPVFAWLFLSGKNDLVAFWIVVAVGCTDWVDGFVARRTGQISALGKILDPIADRAAIVTVLLVLAFRGTIAWPLAASIVGRDAVVSAVFIALERRGFPRLPVNFLGKLATSFIFFGLGFAVSAVAFPQLSTALLLAIANWFLAIGAVLYWIAAGLYLRAILRTGRSRATAIAPDRQ